MRRRSRVRTVRPNSIELAAQRRQRERGSTPKRRPDGPSLGWFALHIGIPLVAGFFSVWLAWSALRVHDPPGAPAIGFDLPRDDALVDFSFRTFAQRYVRSAAEPFRPASSLTVAITTDSCNPWVNVSVTVYADSRWWMAVRARHLGRPFRPTLRFDRGGARRARYARPQTDGTFAFAVSGEIRSARASTFTGAIPLTRYIDAGETILEGRVPRVAVTPRTLINDHIAPAIHLVFRAPWVHDRVPGGCWIAMPQLAGDGGSTLIPLGREGLGASNAGRLGPSAGVTSLTVEGGRVLRDKSDPLPRQGFRPAWSCVAEPRTANYLADHPTCAAAAAVAKPGSEQQLQFRLLLGGGLLSASIAGMAAGVRRRLSRAWPSLWS